jgi:transcriptional regulator with XRE-family HTH domain
MDFMKALKEESGLSYREISRRAGFHQDFARKIADGTYRNPSVLVLSCMAEAAGYDLVILFRER